jgi:uncharacterized protein YegL
MKMLGKDATQVQGTVSGFEFSATPVSKLGASEYTIVDILLDLSGSVQGWETKLEECMKTIVAACRKCPRAENLLLRLSAFNDDVREVHGYVELMKINPTDYDKKFSAYGSTALLDAALNGVESTGQYAKDLNAKDIFCNAVIFVITDGDENSSKIATIGAPKFDERITWGQGKIAAAIGKLRKEEILESVKTVLIGIADVKTSEGLRLEAMLKDLVKNAKIDEFVMIGDMSKGTLAKLAGFVSQSTSSSSQALNTGGPSKAIAVSNIVPIDLDNI